MTSSEALSDDWSKSLFFVMFDHEEPNGDMRSYIRYSNGDKYWYLNGKHHRLNGPAKILNNTFYKHLEPAKFWYVKDEHHRLDGPAVDERHTKLYFLFGKNMFQSRHGKDHIAYKETLSLMNHIKDLCK